MLSKVVYPQAFSLCAVPGTDFNLSYASLTNCDAWQAIQALKKSDPAFHAEITAGCQSVPSEPEDELEDDPALEALPQVSVSKLTDIIMASTVASEVADQLDALETDASSDSDDDTLYAPGPSNAASAPQGSELRQSTRVSNPTYRYGQSQWWNYNASDS